MPRCSGPRAAPSCGTRALGFEGLLGREGVEVEGVARSFGAVGLFLGPESVSGLQASLVAGQSSVVQLRAEGRGPDPLPCTWSGHLGR